MYEAARDIYVKKKKYSYMHEKELHKILHYMKIS